MLQIHIIHWAHEFQHMLFLVLFQLDDDRPHSGPRSNQLRRLASYVFSSSTLETEQYPHAGGSFIQRSRSAESSPAHNNLRSGSRRHAPLQPPGSPRSRHTMLNVSRLQIQQMLAKLMNKNSWGKLMYSLLIHPCEILIFFLTGWWIVFGKVSDAINRRGL